MATVEMSKRIDLERKNVEIAEVITLNLDGCKATEIEGLSGEFKALHSLSIANAGLTTLKGFPSLPQLNKLNLSDNEISNDFENICGCSNLIELNLSGNKIENLEELKPLTNLKHLSSLILNNNSISSTDDYREKVFEMFPHLKFLDGLDQNGNEEKCEDLTNGVEHVDKDINHTNGSRVDSDDEESEDDVDEIGISALQGSKDLEEDDEEEDYIPGEEDIEENEDDEDEDVEDLDEEETANLSGAGVTGPRRATKRKGDEVELDCDSKCKNTDETGDHENVTN